MSAVTFVSAASALAAKVLNGQVIGGGATIANSTLTRWAATRRPAVYLIAKGGTPAASKAGGDNPTIALLTVVGSNPPAKVPINESTTIASMWTHNQHGKASEDTAYWAAAPGVVAIFAEQGEATSYCGQLRRDSVSGGRDACRRRERFEQ